MQNQSVRFNRNSNYKILGLDTIRGFLSISVIFSHAWQTFIFPFYNNSNLGIFFGLLARLSVLSFFALSGYVISMSIQSNVLKYQRFNSVEYAISRFFRIFPPLMFVIIMTMVFSKFLISLDFYKITDLNVSRKVFITNPFEQFKSIFSLCTLGDLTGDGFNGPLWTLAYELKFYVIAALLSCLFYNNKISKIVAGAALYYYLRKIGVFSLLSTSFNIHHLCYLCFLIGFITFKIKDKPWRLFFISFSLIVTLTLFLIFKYPFNIVSNMDENIYSLMFQLLFTLLFCVFIIQIYKKDNFKLFHQTGSFSYTLYIFHYPLMLLYFFLLYHLNRSLLQYTWTNTIVSSILVTYICFLTAKLIENPYQHKQLLLKNLSRLKRLSFILAMAITVSVLIKPALAENIQYFKTNNGIRFGIKGNTTKSPYLFIFTTTIEASLNHQFTSIGEELSKKGFTLVSLDVPCHGQNLMYQEIEGLECWNNRIRNGNTTFFKLFSHQVSEVISFLSKTNKNPSLQIYVLGISRGGFVALETGISDSRIHNLLLMSPVTELKYLLEFKNSRNLSFSSNFLDYSKTLSSKSIFIQIGNSDDRVGTENVLKLIEHILNADKKKEVDLTTIITPKKGHVTQSHDLAIRWTLDIHNKIFSKPMKAP